MMHLLIATKRKSKPRPKSELRRRRRRPSFQVKWARIPAAWRKRLRKTRSANTYHLAIAALFEAYRAEQCGTEIVLSAHATGLSRASRKRAIDELEKLGLIRVRRKGQCAPRIELKFY
jgi:DNA-binding MarR family transcriptional regulator